MSIEFEPVSLTSDPEQLAAWVERNLNRLGELLNNGASFLRLVPQYAEPDKYFDGMLVYADGTNWDPGSGEGIYARYNSTWNKL